MAWAVQSKDNRRGAKWPQRSLKKNSKEDRDILRDENHSQAWKIFESYAAGGLRKIQEWLVNNPTDHDGVETLLIEITKKANDYNDREKEPVKVDLG